jgi:hypothetical protein
LPRLTCDSPAASGEGASARGRSAETTLGYVRIDGRELRPAEGEPSTPLAVDRVGKLAHVASFGAGTEMNGAAFPREVVAAFPRRIHTAPTDDGVAFADPPKYRDGPTARRTGHVFDRVCREHGIAPKLTGPCHPRTDRRAERMDRTGEEATVEASHSPDLAAPGAHALACARDSAEHLERLRWRPPFQAVRDAWSRDPTPFRIDPRHLIPGPHT